MLLVKSKELKNSSKRTPQKCWNSLYLLAFSALFSFPVAAQSDTNELSSPTTFISIFLSLLFVIAIIFALAYVMRRFNVTQAGNGQMKVVASMMAGAKEKIMVVEVGSEQHLIGITAHNINHLATLKEPIATKQNAVLATDGQQGFQQKFVQALASQISGKGKSND